MYSAINTFSKENQFHVVGFIGQVYFANHNSGSRRIIRNAWMLCRQYNGQPLKIKAGYLPAWHNECKILYGVHSNCLTNQRGQSS